MRFAVRWPGTPDASPRFHGVPRRDVPGRVDVSMVGETAGRAREARLALARLPVHIPARRAPLACKRRSDLLHPAWSLLLQSPRQQPPPGPQDAPIQPGFLADVPAWVGLRASNGPGHVCDVEVFDPDQVEAPGDVGTGLFDPVLAPIGSTGAQPGGGQLDPRPAVRAWFGSCQLALQPPQPSAFPQRQAGRAQQFAGRQGRRHRHAPIDADHLPVARRWNRPRDGGECDVPAPGPVSGYPVGLDARRHGPGPAEPHPARLRHPDLADLAAQTPHVPLPPAPPHDSEPLVPASLGPGRSAGRVARVEERGFRLGEVPQRLLLHCLRACGQPRVLGAGGGELPTLLHVARRAGPAGTPVRVLLNGEIPHVPGVRTMARQQPHLSGSRVQPVRGHTNILSTDTDISGEVKRRSLPDLKAGNSTPRS